MSITATKLELASVDEGATCCRKAEVATMLRFGGDVSVHGGRPVVTTVLDTQAAVDRLCAGLADVFRRRPVVTRLDRPSQRPLYLVRVIRDAEILVRQVGLLDQLGKPIIGLPTAVTVGKTCDAAASWRGAVLAAGSMVKSRRKRILQVACPNEQTAVGLSVVANRLGSKPTVGSKRDQHHVALRGREVVTHLLAQLGARESLADWADDPATGKNDAWTTTLPGANDARRAAAAAEVTARTRWALDVLDDGHCIDASLLYTARLRVEHEQASLQDLALMHDPMLSKAGVSKRLDRFCALAAERAAAFGLPLDPTTAGIPLHA